MYKPLISIIIPVYNVEQYLDDCINSIINQTYSNLEIILIDDGSTDRCPEMCDSWAKKDSRIKVIHQKNGGAALARNTGLDVATGDYIGFVDSDDYIADNMYEELLTALTNSDKKIACCLINRVFNDGTIVPEVDKDEGVEILDIKNTMLAIFCKKIGNAVWCKLHERSVFDNLRFPTGEINEDFPVIVPSSVSSQGMVLVRKPLYYYRKRDGSVTSRTSLATLENVGIVRKNMNLMEQQLNENNINCNKYFKFFLARVSFSLAIVLEKEYNSLNDHNKKELSLLKNILRKNLMVYLFSPYSSLKDKLLYLMVITSTLRISYKLIGKEI